jgi:cytidylate kinase
VIVWLNGAFGVGKTTTAGILAGAGRLRAFDPEMVGALLTRHLADEEIGDFQNLPGWRRLVPAVMHEIVDITGDDLVAVQSVLVESHWRELRAGLTAVGLDVFHVVLDVSATALARRIDADSDDPAASTWRHAHGPVYRAERRWMVAAADLVVDTSTTSAADVAATISAAIR